MKNEISSLELYYLSRELKALEGSKIDGIYQDKNDPKEMAVACHVTGQGKRFLKIRLPGIILMDDSRDQSESPTGFCMMLRKYLEGARIRSIEQKDFERTLTISIESKKADTTEQYFIIVELFSKGNIIFCDEKFKVLNILEEQKWKDRELKRQQTYTYPKSRSNILVCTEQEFKSALSISGKESIVKALAITFNLGGTYAEELCARSGIKKEIHPDAISQKESDALYRHALLMLHEETKANSVEDNIFPFMMTTFRDKEQVMYPSLNDAIVKNYDNIKHFESKKETSKNLDKIQNVIDEQTKLLGECEEAYKENQRKGELLYERYQQISDILSKVKQAREKQSWAAIKQKIDSNPELRRIIKDIDEKTSSIIIEIDP